MNHKKILLQQSKYLHSMVCVFSEMNVTVAAFLRPEFLSKAEVNVPRNGEHPNLVLGGSWDVAKMST